MCGFAGVHEADLGKPVVRSMLEQMLRPILHRGPDGTGYHDEPGIGLAFCRLAIIDVEHGDQPMASDDGSVWLVFNGEIYNFRQLREELEAKGHRFRTSSDTEVLLRSYAEWGRECVRHLRGIFAFAIWDRGRRELFLARDHSGIKPLYLAIEPNRTLFASEAKAILSQPELRRGIDFVGYLGGNDFSGHFLRTAFLGIVELAPGCTMFCTPEGRSTTRYWTYEPSEEPGRENGLVLIEKFKAAVHEAVGMQLVADVPIAASLSGGVDSAAIVASMVLHGRRDVRTYTVEFEGDETGDVRHAQLSAMFLKVENVKVPVSMADAGDIARTAWFAEGEFDLGFVARHALSKKVYADGAKVLLSGQGIDEILTGYHKTYEAFRRGNLIQKLRAEMAVSYRGWPVFTWDVIDQAGGHLSTFLGRNPSKFWAQISADQLTRDFGRLANGMLRFEDRMGMAGHVEVRVPFLDHHVLELCASVPEESRAELFSSKKILRAAVSQLLPRQIAWRPKVGFNVSAVPLSKLVIEGGGDLVDLLEEPAVKQRGWFYWEDVQGMRSAGDYRALDHVLILHLLDELFMRNYDASR